MEVDIFQSVEFHAGAADEGAKQKWVEEHALRLQHLFEQWQKPLGINCEEYREFLTKQLSDYYDQPLQKSLIELIP